MLKKQTTLIFTDLDGTLLDHHTYSHQPVDSLLSKLEEQNVPVMPCTSKTRAEIEQLRKGLDNQHPFIVENGAAVYIPAGYFEKRPPGCVEQEGYWVKSFSEPRSHWQLLLSNLAPDFPDQFISFSEAGVDGIAEMTGLSLEAAAMANERDHSEPVRWLGSPEKRDEFVDAAFNRGANVLIGGRFVHLTGECDKGLALEWLAEQFELQDDTVAVSTIALGDSHNDIAMLEAADIAVVIRSPIQRPPSLEREEGVILSRLEGPEGWAEEITSLVFN
ncbi:MAG: HAD-IIB family hydrolase [Pontibacterium sp.]